MEQPEIGANEAPVEKPMEESSTPNNPVTAEPVPVETAGSPYPWLFRLCHWMLGGSMLVLVITGFSLHAAARPEWSIFHGVLPSWLLGGRVNLWHLIASLFFFPAVITAIWASWRGQLWERATHIFLLGGGLLSVISGLLLMTPFGSFTVYSVSRGVHAAVGLFLVIPLLWHAVTGLTRFRSLLGAAFRPWGEPQWGRLVVFLLIAVVTTCLTLHGLPMHPPWQNLVAKPLPASTDTTDMGKLPWSEASPLVIQLANGVGFKSGQLNMTLRAVYDKTDLFVLAEWDDPEANRRYMPWQKNGDGWTHQVSNPKDENIFYEDKFALIFPAASDWGFDHFSCTMYCHVDGKNGFGYKGADQTVDVWHWKATRTGSSGKVDDKYWLGFDFTLKDGGRHGDPKQSGGYAKNTSKDKKHPAFLPDDLAACFHGAIPREHAVEYTEEAGANLPDLTIIPGIIAEAFVGDRADVSCVSRHMDGRWRLYMKRRLDTGSEYDVQFVPGGTYPFSCAAFDHSAKRHACALVPYRLVLEQ